MNFVKCLLVIFVISALCYQQEAHGKDNSINWTKISDLHPTQIPIGLRSAKRKAKRYSKMSKTEIRNYLTTHPVPVVIGPEQKLYMVDHHHLCFAFDLIGQKEVAYIVIGDLSDSKNGTEFWRRMINDGEVYGKYKWAYDRDEKGNKLSLKEFTQKISSNVRKMKDDPFRSIAARLLNRGDYNKKPADYFIEFVIADFLRQHFSYENNKDWYERTLIKSEKILDKFLHSTKKCSKLMEALTFVDQIPAQ